MKKLISILCILPLLFGCGNNTNPDIAGRICIQNDTEHVLVVYPDKTLIHAGKSVVLDANEGQNYTFTVYDWDDRIPCISDFIPDEDFELEEGYDLEDGTLYVLTHVVTYTGTVEDKGTTYTVSNKQGA